MPVAQGAAHERPVQVPGVDARAVVQHGQRDPVGMFCDPDLDRPVRLGDAQRVLEQAVEQLPDALRVLPQRRRWDR
ncbi:hypothetical protein GCM10017712_05600 [Curtobacterium citreum]